MVGHLLCHVLEDVTGPVGPVEATAEVDGGHDHADRDDGGQTQDQGQR